MIMKNKCDVRLIAILQLILVCLTKIEYLGTNVVREEPITKRT